MRYFCCGSQHPLTGLSHPPGCSLQGDSLWNGHRIHHLLWCKTWPWAGFETKMPLQLPVSPGRYSPWCCKTLTPIAGSCPSSPALQPAPWQGPHPAPDRTDDVGQTPLCSPDVSSSPLMSIPEASVLLLHSSEIRNRFSLLWVSNRDFSLLGFCWHTLICTLQLLREMMGL